MKSILLLAAAGGATAGFLLNSVDNVVTYWGQNSYGQGSGELAQQRLATYCANTDIDVIPMAFLYQITTGIGGQPVVNFANQQNNCTTFDDTGLLNCPEIAEDIVTCQSKYKKTILLSVGGATYTEGGFSSPDIAKQAAEKMWATFGPKQDESTLRPFNSAVIDGFDMDFETTMNNAAPFANRLRELMDQDTTKQYFLTAAPQCPYPDHADNEMLNGSTYFDAIFIQFYNNYCGVNSFVPGSIAQTNFNFETWNNWTRTVSANPNVKILLGVPANTGAAGTGYLPVSSLGPIIAYCKQFHSFAGVMMWDASQAYANIGFLTGVKEALLSTTSTPTSSSTNATAPIGTYTSTSKRRVRRAFSTSTTNSIQAQGSSGETNMASDDARVQNNKDFQLNELFNVKDKVALITGGGSGIGLMYTQALAVNGAKVYICGRTGEKLDTVAKTYSQDIPGSIIPIAADITSKQEIQKLYDELEKREGHLDILVNNAGIMSDKTITTEAQSPEEMKKNMFDDDKNSFQDWDDIYRTNVSQCYFMSTCFIPLLAKATQHTHGYSGTIINVSSISGQVKTSQHHPQYNASKAACIHLTRMLANEIAQNQIKIRVNTIAPGVFPSEMTAGSSGANQKSAIPKDKFENKVPAARPGNDRDMASTLLFCATNTYLNGQTITVDGGYTLAAGM
ncbi:NAD(P)-binding protein [Hortaea werneckii]|nr:NAD(P)-binding protein [Hortaea werneckii]